MPDLPAKVRRAALEALGRDSLANLTTKFNLAVQDRRAAAAHVDALMRSRAVEFPAVLGELPRDDLKAICEALALDPSGREKVVLVTRILRGPGAAPAPRNGRRRLRHGQGEVRINWRIVQAPMVLVDYVLAHEAVHLKHRNHTRVYRAELGRLVADVDGCRADLRRRGAAYTW